MAGRSTHKLGMSGLTGYLEKASFSGNKQAEIGPNIYPIPVLHSSKLTPATAQANSRFLGSSVNKGAYLTVRLTCGWIYILTVAGRFSRASLSLQTNLPGFPAPLLLVLIKRPRSLTHIRSGGFFVTVPVSEATSWVCLDFSSPQLFRQLVMG